MRVTDSMKYDLFVLRFSSVKAQLDQVQERLAANKKVSRPSDNPVAFAKGVELGAEQVLYEQFGSNITQAKTVFSLYNLSFNSIREGLSVAKTVAADHATGSMTSSLRESALKQIDSVIEQLVSNGNTMSGGSYIFGGKQTNEAPFRLNADHSVDLLLPPGSEGSNEVYLDRGYRETIGISGRDAFFGATKTLYESASNAYAGDSYCTTDNFVYVIETGMNDTINVAGTDLTLASGVYTGASLANEMQSQLRSLLGSDDCSVAFDSSIRKFVITNNTAADVQLNWSLSNAADTLGFDNVDNVLGSGKKLESDLDSGKKSFLVKILTSGTTTGAAGRATYVYSTDGGATWLADADAIAVSTGGADAVGGDITITAGLNDGICVNGANVLIGPGTYTGSTLATAIEDALDPLNTGSYSVTYNAETRKFSIANNAGGAVTFNWSDSTAAGVLGFEYVDSFVGNGTSDTSDYDAGMFIDGSGVPTAENNGIKLSFSTGTTDYLTANRDSFEISDFSTFAVLKNLRDAIEQDNSHLTGKLLGELGTAMDIADKNGAYIGFKMQRIEVLTGDNQARELRSAEIISNTIEADLAQLSAEYNTLSTIYQSLIYSMSKIQDLNILNYLN
ncbi:MAG: Flagellar hook-associated protein 3 [Syntrophorhabdus sp. PtaU1.Bin153]|nr:MAG: Flagellar hook-associated protein 3 [Syntrophorhabdus sp. PtaU1.Bin153]